MSEPAPDRQRVVVAITGASGSCYGIRTLELLAREPDIEVHLIVTRAGAATIKAETSTSARALGQLADVVHHPGDIGASIASGSTQTVGMIVAPCSIKTLSAIATSYSSDLVSRAADVTLKEGRPLILVVRETPLHLGHLRLMTAAAEVGAVIAPPAPAFYHRPSTIDEIVDDSARRTIERLGIGRRFSRREWSGLTSETRAADDEEEST